MARQVALRGSLGKQRGGGKGAAHARGLAWQTYGKAVLNQTCEGDRKRQAAKPCRMTPTLRPLFATLAAATASLGIAGISHAQAPILPLANAAISGQELPPYLQCVPYAREVSGIAIYGDAHTWWEQAAGRYDRGNKPRVGAVMAFVPHRNMRLGHVAAVSRVIDSRTVLLDHANWSPINGERGQIEPVSYTHLTLPTKA